jgi:hypothetical protein
MRLAGVVTRGRKRRPITRRDWRSDRRTGARRRVWIGARRRAPRAVAPLFFALSAQQVERSRAADWLAAAAMLAGVASWGVLAALLGA